MTRPRGATTYARLLRKGERFYWREHTFTVTSEPIVTGTVTVPIREAGYWVFRHRNSRVRLQRTCR